MLANPIPISTQYLASVIVTTYGFHPRSEGLTYRMPARETVAGVAALTWPISKMSEGNTLVAGQRQYLGRGGGRERGGERGGREGREGGRGERGERGEREGGADLWCATP